MLDPVGALAMPLRFVPCETGYSPNKMTQFCIEMTRQCNFRCKYCCFSGDYEKLRAHSNQKQSHKNLNQIVEFIQKNACEDEILIVFYGGEALLALEEIKYVVEKLTPSFKGRIEYSISTNGWLLTPKVVDYLVSMDITVNVTIDGNEAMHDENRVLANGEKTFDNIIQNLSDIKRRYPHYYNTKVQYLATIHSTHDLLILNDAWMSEELLKDHLPIHISTILPNFKKEPKRTNIDVKRRVFYKALEDYKSGKHNVLTNELHKIVTDAQEREVLMSIPKEHTIRSCLNKIDKCFIDCDGNVAVCEKVCDDFRIGNIYSGIDLEKIETYNQLFYSKLNTLCKNCEAFLMCRICPKHLCYNKEEFIHFCEIEKDYHYLSLLMLCEVGEFLMAHNNRT